MIEKKAIFLPVPNDHKIRQAQKLMGEKAPKGTVEVLDGKIFIVNIQGSSNRVAVNYEKLILQCERIIIPYRPLVIGSGFDENGDWDYGDESDYSFKYLDLFNENTYNLEVPVDANDPFYVQLVLSVFAGEDLPDETFNYSELARKKIRLFFNGDGEKYADCKLLGIRPLTGVWWE